MRRALHALLLVPALLAQAPAPSPAAARPPVDLGKLLIDVARMRMDTKNALTSGAFWLSPSVLEAVIQSFNPAEGDAAKGEEVSAILKAIRDYQIFMVQREYLDGLGEQKTVTAEELRATAWLENEDGIRIRAVDSLPQAARDFVAAFKRGMESRSKGQHFELLVFPQSDGKGHAMEKPGKPGKLKLILGKVQGLEVSEFSWHYPLDALSAPRECPKCHEAVSASWSYCAYCGTPSGK